MIPGSACINCPNSAAWYRVQPSAISAFSRPRGSGSAPAGSGGTASGDGMIARRIATSAGDSASPFTRAGGSPNSPVTSTPRPAASLCSVGNRTECFRCCSSFRMTSAETPDRSAKPS